MIERIERIEREVEVVIGDQSMKIELSIPNYASEERQNEYIINYIFENIEIYPL